MPPGSYWKNPGVQWEQQVSCNAVARKPPGCGTETDLSFV